MPIRDFYQKRTRLLGEKYGKLTEENTCFVDKGTLGHTYNTWLSDLYNCMALVFFKYN